MAIDNLALRILRVRPGIRTADFRFDNVNGELHLSAWDKRFDPIPTDAELLAVDLTQPTQIESWRTRAIQILKTDVPDSWKDSTNAQQRIAWAFKRLFVEVRQELKD